MEKKGNFYVVGFKPEGKAAKNSSWVGEKYTRVNLIVVFCYQNLSAGKHENLSRVLYRYTQQMLMYLLKNADLTPPVHHQLHSSKCLITFVCPSCVVWLHCNHKQHIHGWMWSHTRQQWHPVVEPWLLSARWELSLPPAKEPPCLILLWETSEVTKMLFHQQWSW